MALIKKVVPLQNHKMEIELDTGHEIILDFSDKIQKSRFKVLEKDDIFYDVDVSSDGLYINWKNGKFKISLGEICDILRWS